MRLGRAGVRAMVSLLDEVSIWDSEGGFLLGALLMGVSGCAFSALACT